MQRSAVRAVAALSAIAVVGVITAPAMAAEPAAQARATAAILTVAGSPVDSGEYTATHDGTTEATTGTTDPQVADVLSNQSNVSIGVLYQDATTTAADGRGTAYACSGVAGTGAVVVEVGDGSCLTGGDAVTLLPGQIDLATNDFIQSNILDPLTGPLNDALGPVLGEQVLPPLSTLLNEALGALGEIGLVVESAGAIQSTCQATSTAASATSNVADLRAYATFLGEEYDLLSLPVGDIPPNTTAVTDLDVLVQAILDGVQQQLDDGLEGALGPLGVLVDGLTQVNELLIAQISDQLGPIEENVLSLTLNKQSQPTPNSIEVTAIDLQVLPAAAQFIGDSFAGLELGKAFCQGGTYTTAAPEEPTSPPAEDDDEPTPAVPVSVPAGLSGETPAPWGPAALVAMTLLAVAAGGYRFFRIRSDA